MLCLLVLFLHAQYFFLKKEESRLEIVLITSFTILLKCKPINHGIKELFFANPAEFFLSQLLTFLCVHLFPFVNFFFSARTYFHSYAFAWILKHQKYWCYFRWKHCDIIFDWIINTDIYHHNNIINIKFVMTILQIRTFKT